MVASIGPAEETRRGDDRVACEGSEGKKDVPLPISAAEGAALLEMLPEGRARGKDDDMS